MPNFLSEDDIVQAIVQAMVQRLRPSSRGYSSTVSAPENSWAQ